MKFLLVLFLTVFMFLCFCSEFNIVYTYKDGSKEKVSAGFWTSLLATLVCTLIFTLIIGLPILGLVSLFS